MNTNNPYMSAINSTNKRIEDISKIIDQMTIIGIANESNPNFMAIKKNHDKLNEDLFQIEQELLKLL